MGISAGKRKACFKRDGYKCVKCGSADDLTVDHIIPRSLGGPDTLRNLQTMCKPCNNEKDATFALYAVSNKVKNYIKAHWDGMKYCHMLK